MKIAELRTDADRVLRSDYSEEEWGQLCWEQAMGEVCEWVCELLGGGREIQRIRVDYIKSDLDTWVVTDLEDRDVAIITICPESETLGTAVQRQWYDRDVSGLMVQALKDDENDDDDET